MNRNYFYSTSSSKHIASTNNPVIAELCERAMFIANVRKLECPDFGISRGGCTDEFQRYLFMHGRDIYQYVMGRDIYHAVIDKNAVVTNCDGIWNRSAHQFDSENVAYAIDFFPLNVHGRVDYSDPSMALVATCFFEAASEMKIDIDWGGSFKSISDGSHIEIVRP